MMCLEMADDGQAAKDLKGRNKDEGTVDWRKSRGGVDKGGREAEV